MEGLTGLLTIPTAEMQPDRQVSFGVSYIQRDYVSFGSYRYDAYSPYVTISFLPFVEASVRLTRLINLQGSGQAIGDRTPSVRLRFIEEGQYSPAIVLGMHDLLGVFGGESAIHNNALYVVTSKHIATTSFLSEIGFHLGYGVDWIKADNHNFVGLFGGIDFKFFNTLELMTEYDGTHSNGGIRVKFFDHITLLGGWLRWKYFSGGAGVSFGL
ncbi:MAG: YjbH domain-containing protein [Melioribacteraceae bacterium]